MDRKEKVLGFLNNQAKVPLLLQEIASMLGAHDDMDELLSILEDLVSEGKLIKSKRGRYDSILRAGLVSGVFRQNEQGYGFVLQEGDDIFIPEDNTGTAINDDIVLVRVQKTRQGKTEGMIEKVVTRGQKTVIGVYIGGWLKPDNRKINKDILITNKDKSYENQKVVTNITDWDNLLGEVFLTLGPAGDQNTEMLSIMVNHNIPISFPEKVIDAAARYDSNVLDEEISGRRDLRNLLTVTIDGATARDLDDAVSIEQTDDGYRLYVHIADVSHYVPHKGVIDQEALKRGTSCYFPDRVSPMLPQSLSNGICSLHPGVDRLALTTVMNFDNSGALLSHEIYEAVIKSDYRLVYEDVTKLLEDKRHTLWENYEPLRNALTNMEQLAKTLRAARIASGGVDLNIPEAEIFLDEDGHVADVQPREHSISHQIIEEFMLACNKTVAEHAFWAELPFVYRIHEEPDEEKAEAFKLFAQNMGHKIRGRLSNKRMAELLDEVRGEKTERVISTFMLRSMMKAKYSAENLGHFGIAARFYCHFTSPIRRYPDLVCHRIIKDTLRGRNPQRFGEFTVTAAHSSSGREETAERAERDAVRYMMCEYMEQNIGREFKGIISSITSFGFFVALDNTIEGLVRLESIQDDYYIFDEKTLSLMGERRKRIFKIGDAVTVLTAAVDRDARWIDFELRG